MFRENYLGPIEQETSNAIRLMATILGKGDGCCRGDSIDASSISRGEDNVDVNREYGHAEVVIESTVRELHAAIDQISFLRSSPGSWRVSLSLV